LDKIGRDIEECTKLFGLFNWIEPKESGELAIASISTFLKATDDVMMSKYKPLVEAFSNHIGVHIVILFALFELLPQCRRIKAKNFGEFLIDKLKEYVVNNPECLFQYHLLECYYLPTNACYCYASLYHMLRKQQPKKQLPPIVINHLYRILKIEKKAFYAGDRPPEQIMVLLHYLMQLFIYFPVTDHELLKQLHELCIEFRLLPKPYGILADEFVQLLENEYRTPCTALLYKIREDFPAIDIYTSNAKDTRYAEPFEAYLFFGTLLIRYRLFNA